MAVRLRAGNAHDSPATVEDPGRVIPRLRGAFPEAEVFRRADAGFAVPELHEFCEAETTPYGIGLATNPRLVRSAEPLMKRDRRRHEKSGEKAQLYGQRLYRADSRSRPRRVVYEAEVMDCGDDPRIAGTTLPDEPEALHRFYVQRGRSEDRTKGLKNAVFADRLSRHLFDHFRLFPHAAAYVLLFRLRERLARTPLATSQMDALRLEVLKIGTRVQVSELSWQPPGWPIARRLVVVREVLAERPEAAGRRLIERPGYAVHAVVTNLTSEPREVRRFFNGRADGENRIEELGLDFAAGGSCLRSFRRTEAVLQRNGPLSNLLMTFKSEILEDPAPTLGRLRHSLFVFAGLLRIATRRSRLLIGALSDLVGSRFGRLLTRLDGLSPTVAKEPCDLPAPWCEHSRPPTDLLRCCPPLLPRVHSRN